MADYFIDYISGNNSNDGLSKANAWKHSPGDSNASVTPSGTTLAPGDNIYFKGGVSYRGRIALSSSGSASQQIRFIGSGWDGNARITAADLITTTWTACSGASDALGNPNWSNMYYSTIPPGLTEPTQLILYNSGNEFLRCSQDEDASTPIVIDNLSDWKRHAALDATSTTLIDTTYFTSSSSSYFEDAFVGMWTYGNRVEFKNITGFSPATNTISFDSLTNPPNADQSGYYSIVGLPQNITIEGEWGLSTAENRIYLWPPNSADPSTFEFELSVRPNCFFASNLGGYFYDSLILDGSYGGINATAGQGVAIYNVGVRDGLTNTISGCTLRTSRSMDKYYNVYFLGANPSSNVEGFNNTFTNIYGGGFVLNGSANIENNSFFNLSRSAIYLQQASNCNISRNSIENILGVHSNGVSIYLNCSNIMFSYNLIKNSPSILTYQQSSDLTFFGNIFDGAGDAQKIEDNGAGGTITTGNIHWINNAIINNTESNSFVIYAGSEGIYEMHNNIIAGGGTYGSGLTMNSTINASHNIYTALAWWQSSTYGWELQSGESEQSESSIFSGIANNDYSVYPDSPTINSGLNVSSYGFTTDYYNYPRPISMWDIGPVEYQSGIIAAISTYYSAVRKVSKGQRF